MDHNVTPTIVSYNTISGAGKKGEAEGKDGPVRARMTAGGRKRRVALA
jgi:hypothetical protein